MDSDSSDSDVFFDAEDHSLESFVSAISRINIKTGSISSIASSKELSFTKVQQTPSVDIDEEERLLIELKKKAVERWQKEDEELEKRLHELQGKKVTGEGKREETKTQVRDLENRRRKLEEMRQLIREESMLIKHVNDSSPEEDPLDEDAMNSMQSSPQRKSNTIERMEHSYRDSREHIHRRHSRKKRSGSWGDLPRNTSNLQSDSGTESTSREGTSGGSSPRKKLHVPLPSEHETSDDDDDVGIELEATKVVDDVMKDSQMKAKDTSPLSGKDYKLSVNAPDIVMSTKPRAASEFGAPVAPPRRKKSANQASTSSADHESSQLSLATTFKKPNEIVEGLKLQDVMTGSKVVSSEIGDQNVVKSQGSETSLQQVKVQSSKEEDVHVTSDDNKRTKSKDKSKLSPSVATSDPNTETDASRSDKDILEMFFIKNLDTGEEIPLSKAADELPQCINPVDLHIVQRTKEFKGDLLKDGSGIEDDSVSYSSSSSALSSGTRKRRIKKIISRSARKVKNVADRVLFRDEGDTEEEVSVDGKIFKIKSSNSNKGPYDFAQIRMLQELSGEHVGAIWSMKFSPCGRLLATGGQDGILKVWVLKSAYSYFLDLRKKYASVSLSPSNSEEDLKRASAESSGSSQPDEEDDDHRSNAPFMKRPFCCYRGHAADLLDLSWSKNYFILSSSMDKTVRLWHMSRRECLCTFQHIDFVTTIVFHPKDDRYFLSGSLDGKLRLWNIPDKKVTLWNEVTQAGSLITTSNFVNKGKYAVAGTYDGRCIFYTTEQLKYFTQIHVRSTRGRKSKGQKITGIEPVSDNKMLVTSNDSRIRLYDLRDLTLSVKYKGGTNTSSQIKASLSPTGKYIVCGSEDHFIYIWKTRHEFKLSATRRDRNDYWEAIKVHNAVATVAIFAPNPSLFSPPVKALDSFASSVAKADLESGLGEIIISADFTGAIKVVRNYPQKV